MFEDIYFKAIFQGYFLCLPECYACDTRFDTSEKHIHVFFFINFQDSPLAFTQIQII